MHKYIRAIIAGVALVAILLLARSSMAGAGELPATKDGGQRAQVLPAPPNAVAQPGTVRPPEDEIEAKGPGTYTAGGPCMVRIVRLNDNDTLSVDWHPYDVLGEYPATEHGAYLTGVCHVIHFEDGTEVPELLADHGEANICFAATPNVEAEIHVYDLKTYRNLETWVEDGLLCSGVPITGYYFVAVKK